MAKVPVRLGNKRRSNIQRPWPTAYQIMPAWARAGVVWATRVRMTWILPFLAVRSLTLAECQSPATWLETFGPAADIGNAAADELAFIMSSA